MKIDVRDLFRECDQRRIQKNIVKYIIFCSLCEIKISISIL